MSSPPTTTTICVLTYNNNNSNNGNIDNINNKIHFPSSVNTENNNIIISHSSSSVEASATPCCSSSIVNNVVVEAARGDDHDDDDDIIVIPDDDEPDIIVDAEVVINSRLEAEFCVCMALTLHYTAGIGQQQINTLNIAKKKRIVIVAEDAEQRERIQHRLVEVVPPELREQIAVEDFDGIVNGGGDENEGANFEIALVSACGHIKRFMCNKPLRAAQTYVVVGESCFNEAWVELKEPPVPVDKALEQYEDANARAMMRGFGVSKCMYFNPEHFFSPQSSVNEKTIENEVKEKVKLKEPSCTMRLRCGHTCPGLQRLHAKQSFTKCDLEKCAKLCARLMTCGHRCPGLCWEKCDAFSCAEQIRVNLPCGHHVEVGCPARDQTAQIKCSVKVQKQWPICGHSAEVPCSEDVLLIPCKVPCEVQIGCGHFCRGNCGDCRNGRHHIECTEPCTRVLFCGHTCRDWCSSLCPPCLQPCEQGCPHNQCNPNAVRQRLTNTRKRKASSFALRPTGINNKVLLGQRNFLKNDVRAGRICGEPCPPCAEPCANRCPHRQCSLTCGRPCDVEPCRERCTKQLPCSPPLLPEGIPGPCERPHFCIGMCGEPCPTVCRLCNPEQFSGTEGSVNEPFFHTEDPESPLVCLPNCGHFVEVHALDQWMASHFAGNQAPERAHHSGSTNNDDNEAHELRPIRCPKCRTVIYGIHRYTRELNQRSSDLEQIKAALLGGKTGEQLLNEARDSIRRMNISSAGKDPELPPANRWNEAMLTFTKRIARLGQALANLHRQVEDHRWTSLSGGRGGRLMNELRPTLALQLRAFSASLNEEFPHRNSLNVEAIELSARLQRVRSDFSLRQLANEIARFQLMFNFFKWFDGIIKTGLDVKLGDRTFTNIKAILAGIFSSAEFRGELKERLSKTMQTISEHLPGFAVSRSEIVQINDALRGREHIQQWYKCANGHLYGVGNCGNPEEASRCPDCKEMVGRSSIGRGTAFDLQQLLNTTPNNEVFNLEEP